MYQARYYKTDGSAGTEVSLPRSLFDGVVNEAALHQVIKAYQANQRQGTAAGKSRGQVAGGSRKPWRQKGTGRARQGTIRAAQWAGGGLAFPPQPHSWNQKIPKKVRALARRSAFNDRAEAGRVVVVEAFDIEAPKTKRLMALLSAMETEGKVLVLTNGVNRSVHLSGRNLPDVHVLPFGTESPYDVIWSGTVVIEEGALESVSDEPREARSGRRRAIDLEAMAEAVEAQEARQAARAKAPRSRRVKGADIDLSAPVLTKGEGAAVEAPKPRKTKAEKVEAQPEPALEVEAAPAPEAEAAPPSEVEILPAPEAEAEAAPEPEAEPAPEEAEAEQAESGFDAATVALPKVSDLADFLAGVDSVADVETLRDRDTRKTAAPIYAARIEELS